MNPANEDTMPSNEQTHAVGRGKAAPLIWALCSNRNLQPVT
jgi:hypothetical protein